MRTTDKKLEGARAERKAIRAFVLRQVKAGKKSITVEAIRAFLDTRNDRYDVRSGGLGKK